MNDLISRAALIKEIENGKHPEFYDGQDIANWQMQCIGNAPAVDAEPVQRGVWEWYEEWWHGECDEYGWRCSVCGVSLADSIEEAIGERPDLDNPDKVPIMKRCPNCEAKMDLEDEQ